ncbi:hypothetical protein SITYG_10050 [Streptococcus intermedius]|uniref:Uncharacterized protein n=1 Tax=Streptococcus intermedius TaxID=1338 RepID=A0AAD1C8M0_STRIT|nr:hypothetical protein D593_0964 [Streptococcus intermedius BA1]BAW16986.1 hypothetical protein SITYG_10050 [Streptococcus intermedius]
MKKQNLNGSIPFHAEIAKILKFKLNKLNPDFNLFILDIVLGKDLRRLP